ncbi:hypothetical protein ACHAQJ_005233 [Trichoderma viride]
MEAVPELPAAVLGALSRPLSIEFLGTDRERRSFYFFRQKTVPQLSGFLGDEVWGRLMLQAALHEPSVRHAILALGSLHARFDQDNNLVMRTHINGWTDSFALENYSKAISVLVKSLSQESQPAIDVCLICSILFACLETMQSSYGSAIAHVQSGMKILCEIKYNKETRRYQHDVLRASEIPGQKWEKWERYGLTEQQYAPKSEIPTIFSTLSNVGELLISHWRVASYSTSDIWYPKTQKLLAAPQVGAWQKKSGSILARWSSAYDVYLNIRGDNLTNEKRRGTAGLRILKELGSTAAMLSQTMADDQTNWDVFCPMFQNVVSLSEDIIKLDSNTTAERDPFCMSMALVGPLFQISCRCRDPIIRRRAILILRQCGRVEGTWNAFSASKVAQRVLEIEEAGLKNVRGCEDVPSWARISNVSPVFDPVERRATLTYSRQRNEHDPTRITIVDVLEW